MKHAITRKAWNHILRMPHTLCISCKLLVVENVVVFAQGKRRDADSLEHVLVELSAPVHQWRGEHQLGEIALLSSRDEGAHLV